MKPAALDAVAKARGYEPKPSKSKASAALAEARKWARSIPANLSYGDRDKAQDNAHRAIAAAVEGLRYATGDTAIALSDFAFYEGVHLDRASLLTLATL